VVVGLLVLVIRRLLGNYITDALASPGYQPATHRLWLIGTAILGQIGAAAILYGVVAALGAIFAGPTQPAVWLRQRLAPYLNEQQGIIWAVVGFVYLLLVLWGGTHALRTWWGILLLAGLLAVGVVALRRETLREFPSAAPAMAGGPPPEEPPTQPTQPTAPQRSPAEEIARLQELHDSGAITDDEFERAKNALA
jgi:MFS family permease